MSEYLKMYNNKMYESIEQVILRRINEYYQSRFSDINLEFIDEADLFFDTNKAKMSPFDPEGGSSSWGGWKTHQ